MSVFSPVSIACASPPLTGATNTRTIGLPPPAGGYRSSSASPTGEVKSTRGYFATLLSFISKYAIAEESGAHQYAVVISSSSGYTQSSSPLRTSSFPPSVNARLTPLAHHLLTYVPETPDH